MVRVKGYFVETKKDFEERTLRYFENYKYDRYLFRIFNNPNTRLKGHSSNKILRYPDGSPYAVHCNCGCYHPVFFGSTIRHEVDWSVSIKTETQSSVLGMLRNLWKMEI